MKLLTILKTYISYAKTYLSKYLWVAIAVLVVSLSVTTKVLYNKVKTQDNEIGMLTNNVKQYQSLASGLYIDNRVLEFKLSDLSHSNDSLVQSLDSTRKALKIKDKQLKQLLSVSTAINDTTDVVLPDSVNCHFTTELKPNQLTTYKISRVGNKLTHIANIFNRQDLFVFTTKEYRRYYKNFIVRLFHLDFKRDEINRYNIVNTNPSITVLDTRVINIVQ
jgi:hypothetical protein